MEQQDPNTTNFSAGKAGMGKGTTKIGSWYFRYCPVCGLLERKHTTCAGDWKEVEGDWIGLCLTEFRELEEWIDYGDKFHDASVHDFGYYAPMKCEHWMENGLEEEAQYDRDDKLFECLNILLALSRRGSALPLSSLRGIWSACDGIVEAWEHREDPRLNIVRPLRKNIKRHMV